MIPRTRLQKMIRNLRPSRRRKTKMTQTLTRTKMILKAIRMALSKIIKRKSLEKNLKVKVIAQTSPLIPRSHRRRTQKNQIQLIQERIRQNQTLNQAAILLTPTSLHQHPRTHLILSLLDQVVTKRILSQSLAKNRLTLNHLDLVAIKRIRSQSLRVTHQMYLQKVRHPTVMHHRRKNQAKAKRSLLMTQGTQKMSLTSQVTRLNLIMISQKCQVNPINRLSLARTRRQRMTQRTLIHQKTTRRLQVTLVHLWISLNLRTQASLRNLRQRPKTRQIQIVLRMNQIKALIALKMKQRNLAKSRRRINRSHLLSQIKVILISLTRNHQTQLILRKKLRHLPNPRIIISLQNRQPSLENHPRMTRTIQTKMRMTKRVILMAKSKILKRKSLLRSQRMTVTVMVTVIPRLSPKMIQRHLQQKTIRSLLQPNLRPGLINHPKKIRTVLTLTTMRMRMIQRVSLIALKRILKRRNQRMMVTVMVIVMLHLSPKMIQRHLQLKTIRSLLQPSLRLGLIDHPKKITTVLTLVTMRMVRRAIRTALLRIIKRKSLVKKLKVEVIVMPLPSLMMTQKLLQQRTIKNRRRKTKMVRTLEMIRMIHKVTPMGPLKIPRKSRAKNQRMKVIAMFHLSMRMTLRTPLQKMIRNQRSSQKNSLRKTRIALTLKMIRMINRVTPMGQSRIKRRSQLRSQRMMVTATRIAMLRPIPSKILRHRLLRTIKSLPRNRLNHQLSQRSHLRKIKMALTLTLTKIVMNH